MIRIVTGLFAALAFASLAQAAEMRPMEATSISLGEVTGVAFYTETADGFQVVATLAAGEEGTPMRFVTTLAEGQKMTVSVPQAADEAPVEVVFARFGNSISVADGTATAMTN
jgi:hypothetical protein